MEGCYLTDETELCCLKLPDFELVVYLRPRGVHDHKVDEATFDPVQYLLHQKLARTGDDHPLDGLLVSRIP